MFVRGVRRRVILLRLPSSPNGDVTLETEGRRRGILVMSCENGRSLWGEERETLNACLSLLY